MSLPPAEFFWKILAKSFKLPSEQGWGGGGGGGEGISLSTVKNKIKKKNQQKNSCICAEEIPVSLCCETEPDNFGEGFEPGC